MSTDRLFNTGFSELSFFNHYKNITYNLYNEALSKDHNIKPEYKIGCKFFYDTDKRLNARATHKGNMDIIFMNVGALGNIYECFYTLFNNKNVFPNIGDPKTATSKKCKFFFDENKKRLAFLNGPIDILRRDVAGFLALLAIRFIIAHEVGHHLNGHVMYLKEKTGHFELLMLNNFFETISPLNYKTIEMDADAFAITDCITNIMTNYETFKNNTYFNRILKDRNEIFKLWMFAIHSLFLLFERHTKEIKDINKALYLPTNLRQLLNINASMHFIECYLKVTKNKYEENFHEFYCSEIKEAIDYAELCFNETFNENHNFLRKITNNIDALVHSDIVLNNWKNIKPDLERYSRLELFDKNNIEKIIESNR